MKPTIANRALKAIPADAHINPELVVARGDADGFARSEQKRGPPPVEKQVYCMRELQALGLGNPATIYKRIRAGTFPAPIHFGDRSRQSRWLVREVQAWIAARIAERDRARASISPAAWTPAPSPASATPPVPSPAPSRRRRTLTPEERAARAAARQAARDRQLERDIDIAFEHDAGAGR